MAEKAMPLDEAISLALRLSTVDRLKLVERVVSSIESEMSEIPIAPTSNSKDTGNWGAELVALINQLDLTDWEQMDIPDVGEWVHQLRRKESERHERYWRGEE